MVLLSGCAAANDSAGSDESSDSLQNAKSKPGLFGIDAVNANVSCAGSTCKSTAVGNAMNAIGAKRIRVEVTSSMTDAELLAILADLPAGARANLQFDYTTLDAAKYGAFMSSTGSPAAWRSYVSAFSAEAARRAKVAYRAHPDKIGVFQIWNEQDFKGRDGYHPYLLPNLFAETLSSSCTALKTAVPTVNVITGGFASVRAERWPYIESVEAAGGFRCVDGIGYHTYGTLDFKGRVASAFDCKSVNAAYPNLKCAVVDLAHDVAGIASRAHKPVFVDEWGLDSMQGTTDASRDRVVAANITAFLEVAASLPEVHEASYYGWNTGGDAALDLSSMRSSQLAFKAASK
jgi:hypothetical protein